MERCSGPSPSVTQPASTVNVVGDSVLPCLNRRLWRCYPPWSALFASGVHHGPPRQLEGFFKAFAVTCPVALYPATSDTEKVSFNQINRKTGPHQIRQRSTPLPARRFVRTTS